MGLLKSREERRVVFVTCRLRDDNGWSDMTICNLSPHGLMARCKAPPPRGAFVEIRKGGVTIVGQVRWSQDNRIGIRAQKRIDLLSLLEESTGPKDRAKDDRRMRSREACGAKARPTPAALAARSRQWSRLFDRIVIASIGVVAAGLLAGQVHSLLTAPLEQAKAALAR